MMNWRVIYSGSGVSNKLSSLPGSSKFSHFCHGFHSIDLVWPIFWIPMNRRTGWHKLQSRDAPELCSGRCCCEAEVLTGDMRPRETRSRVERGDCFYDPWPCAAHSVQCCPVTTLHITHPTWGLLMTTDQCLECLHRVPGVHCYTVL